ncbi:MAG: magnesium transporter CorA family protein [Anaerolineae bacterium]
MIRSLVVSSSVDLNSSDFIIGRNLPPEKLEQALAGGDRLWIDVVDSEEHEITWLETQLKLHPSVVTDLRSEDRRPALLVYPRYLFLSLFQPYNRLNKFEGKEIHCLIGENFFVTVRKADAAAVDNAYNRVAANPLDWRQGVPYFLYLTIQHVIDSYYPLLDKISDHLNTLEEKLMANGGKGMSRKPVYAIKQQLIALRQMVAPQREVLSSVVGAPPLSQSDEHRDLFRHLYERLLRIYDVIDSQRDLAMAVLDMMDSQESNKLALAVNRLTIISMIFLPMTFLANFFQLNFTTIAEPAVLPVNGWVLFWGIVTLMVTSAALMIVVMRKRGWL